MNKELSIIIPIYNEEEILPELYERLKTTAEKITANYELIFVNDGSKDQSFARILGFAIQNANVHYINFSRNFGHQIAVTAGLDYCSGDAVAIIDGDLQDPPELIEQLYSKFKEGYEVVYAKRAKRKGETWLKKMTAKIFYRILNNITTIDLPLDTGDFRIVDKKIVSYLRQMPEQNKFLRGQIAWLGFRQSYVLFDREQRKYGTTGYSYSQMIRFAMNGITGFSNSPLKMVSKIGFGVSIIAFLVILYAFYSYFIMHRTISGWTSLMVSTMFIGGIQLISIGVIGEYISRINNDVRKRPLYIVDKANVERQES
jgi:polyisoprenyl-phosphate glycosyltransferase